MQAVLLNSSQMDVKEIMNEVSSPTSSQNGGEL